MRRQPNSTAHAARSSRNAHARSTNPERYRTHLTPSEIGTYRSDGEGNWLRDGTPSPELQGCFDVDIAATAFTNTFVIRRLELSMGETAKIRAAWVGVPHLEVEALEQTYVRLDPLDGHYRYRAGGAAEGWIIEVDQDAVAMDYEGFARRIRP